jgi:putative phosphoesterase
VLLGVVSDTHGQTAYALQAARLLASLNVETVLHCGDIGAPEIVAVFAEWPTHYVLGNVDGVARSSLEKAMIATPRHQCHGRFADLKLDGRRVAVTHGDDLARLSEAIRCGDYHLVCHGHTHCWRHERVGSTLVVNPGALYRAHPHTLATIDLATMEVARFTV